MQGILNKKDVVKILKSCKDPIEVLAKYKTDRKTQVKHVLVNVTGDDGRPLSYHENADVYSLQIGEYVQLVHILQSIRSSWWTDSYTKFLADLVLDKLNRTGVAFEVV